MNPFLGTRQLVSNQEVMTEEAFAEAYRNFCERNGYRAFADLDTLEKQEDVLVLGAIIGPTSEMSYWLKIPPRTYEPWERERDRTHQSTWAQRSEEARWLFLQEYHLREGHPRITAKSLELAKTHYYDRAEKLSTKHNPDFIATNR